MTLDESEIRILAKEINKQRFPGCNKCVDDSLVRDDASEAGLDVVRGKMGDMVLDGFAGLDDLGDSDGFEALEDGGLLMEPVRKSSPVLGNRW